MEDEALTGNAGNQWIVSVRFLSKGFWVFFGQLKREKVVSHSGLLFYFILLLFFINKYSICVSYEQVSRKTAVVGV